MRQMNMAGLPATFYSVGTDCVFKWAMGYHPFIRSAVLDIFEQFRPDIGDMTDLSKYRELCGEIVYPTEEQFNQLYGSLMDNFGEDIKKIHNENPIIIMKKIDEYFRRYWDVPNEKFDYDFEISEQKRIFGKIVYELREPFIHKIKSIFSFLKNKNHQVA